MTVTSRAKRSSNEQTTNKNQKINEQNSIVNHFDTDSCNDLANKINEQNNEKSTSNISQNQRHLKNIIEDKNIKETSLTRGKENTAAVATVSSASDEAEAPKPKKARRENMPFKEIKDLWNEVCEGYPKLHSLSESRKNKMRNRISEMGGAEKAMPLLRDIFGKMQASSFLKGDNRRGWKASFDWLFENDKNWVKVYEGNYDNRPERQSPTRYDNNKNCNDEWK